MNSKGRPVSRLTAWGRPLFVKFKEFRCISVGCECEISRQMQKYMRFPSNLLKKGGSTAMCSSFPAKRPFFIEQSLMRCTFGFCT
ncbi:Uncharacterised protein [Paenibacillus macerans]|nr:Uncharacterised protein [Paenibacillus macerans]